MMDFMKKMTTKIKTPRDEEPGSAYAPNPEPSEPRNEDPGQPAQAGASETISLYQKCTDKISLDLVSAVESIVSDRQMAFYRIGELEDLTANANDHIFRLNRETERLNNVIREKDDVIRGMEEKLTTKQMMYDQLMEDFGEYQDNTKIEINDLKFQLDKANGKYDKLSQEFRDSQADFTQKVQGLEERIRDLDVQNQKVTGEYLKALDEKNRLMKIINQFTESMNLTMNLRSDKPLNFSIENPEVKDPDNS